MKKKVSLKDIANRVGVSTALVSYVLNNKKEGRISEESARKIREAAREMNYRTNQIARSLKTNKTFTIGLVIADISNPFFSRLARIIEDEAELKNYTVIIGSSDEKPEKFCKLVDTFLDKQVDGLIIAATDGTESCLNELIENNIPFVLVDRYFPSIHANYVALDNFKAAFTATQHLISIGCNNIGMVTYNSPLFNLTERKKGFLAALKENGNRNNRSRLKEVSIKARQDEVEKAVANLLSSTQPVDGLLFGSNTIAVQAVKYINTLPLRVPKDLALICFDETDSLDLFYAPLTYIRQPLEDMARQATAILLDRMDKNNKITQVNIEGELIIRKSA